MSNIFQDLIQLIDKIPELLIYMVQGYIFISIYNFMLFKKNELDHVFFKSVVVSYILKIIFDSILSVVPCGQVNGAGYIPLLFLFSVASGYGCARLSKTEKVNRFLLLIGIRRTVSPTIWEDVIEPYTWVMYYCKSRELVYYGQFKYGDENGSEPIIALVRYKVMDLDGNTIEDNSSDDSEVVLLNTKDFERIELTYERQYYKNNPPGGGADESKPIDQSDSAPSAEQPKDNA